MVLSFLISPIVSMESQIVPGLGGDSQYHCGQDTVNNTPEGGFITKFTILSKLCYKKSMCWAKFVKEYWLT